MHHLATGAEARIYSDGHSIIKERRIKGYRHPIIDQSLRSSRTRREARVLTALSRIGFPSPKLILMDDGKGILSMDLVEGVKLSTILNKNPKEFGTEIGQLLGILHNNGIVHGDPTTSNMIVGLTGTISLIDFGLSQFSKKIEDKAVDLHLLDRAIESAHHEIHSTVMAAALASYSQHSPESSLIISRFEAVQKRGRNRMKGS